jgi:hypothetical protein
VMVALKMPSIFCFNVIKVYYVGKMLACGVL